MAAEEEGARPTSNRPAAQPTVDPERDQRLADYRARARRANELAMDRYIEHVYGPDWVARSRR